MQNENHNNGMPGKKPWMKILVPLVIISLIVGLWFVKSGMDKKPSPETAAQVQETQKDDTSMADRSNAMKKTEEQETKTVDEKAQEGSAEGAENKAADTKKEAVEANKPDFSFQFTKALDFKALAKHGLPVIADYGAEGCQPCRKMAPDLKKVHKAMEGKAFIKYADVWQNQESADNVPVRVTPTQVFFNADGSPFVPSEKLAKEIYFQNYNLKETGEHALTVHEGILTEAQMLSILKEMGVNIND